MATTITNVTLPQHMYSHVETKINDNTIRTYVNERPGMIKMLAVFTSPKGIDRKITTIANGLDEFKTAFGDGPFSIYGQPFLNAKAAASTDAAILQCMRITAPDATYAHRHIYIRYKVVTEDGGTKKMQIQFVPKCNKPDDGKVQVKDLKELLDPSRLPDDSSNLADWKEERFLTVAARGRGIYGNSMSFRITSDTRYDKISAHKNYYFTIYENTEIIEERRFSFHPEASKGGKSYYIGNVINDPDTGSPNVYIDVNDNALEKIYTLYKDEIDPKTEITEAKFDIIGGVKPNSTEAIFDIITDDSIPTCNVTETLGISLEWGSDGSFAPGANLAKGEKGLTLLDDTFIHAFEGEIDRNILSKYRCPIDVVLDANFKMDVKKSLAALNTKRHEDHITYFDMGTELITLDMPYDNENIDAYNDDITGWTFSIDAYYGKIRDPYNNRIIEVTSTYNLAKKLPLHWKNYNGKHIPYAGDYGVIDSYIKDSVYPVYDDSIDDQYLDKLKDAHINYAQIDAKGRIIRANQDTRYPVIDSSITVSNLTELNNCHVILDIKKDAENIAAGYLYHFNEAADLVDFNLSLENITSKYAAAQVKKISAKPARTDEEAELGILHLYIEVVHKALVKIVQIDIDVNRSVES